MTRNKLNELKYEPEVFETEEALFKTEVVTSEIISLFKPAYGLTSFSYLNSGGGVDSLGKPT